MSADGFPTPDWAHPSQGGDIPDSFVRIGKLKKLLPTFTLLCAFVRNFIPPSFTVERIRVLFPGTPFCAPFQDLRPDVIPENDLESETGKQRTPWEKHGDLFFQTFRQSGPSKGYPRFLFLRGPGNPSRLRGGSQFQPFLGRPPRGDGWVGGGVQSSPAGGSQPAPFSQPTAPPPPGVGKKGLQHDERRVPRHRRRAGGPDGRRLPGPPPFPSHVEGIWSSPPIDEKVSSSALLLQTELVFTIASTAQYL